MAIAGRLVAMDDEGLDEAVLRKPDLPKNPEPPDLRKVQGPDESRTNRAAKEEAAHKEAVAVYMQKKREYDEAL